MGTILLKSGELTLRRHTMEDAKILHRILGQDPEITRYTGWNPYKTPQMAEKTVAGFIKGYEKTHFYGWAIERDGELIGTIGAYDYDPEKKCIETGYSIGRAFWGKGYATRALQIVIEHLGETEGIRMVKAWCEEENIGSVRVLEKNGFRHTEDLIEDGRKKRIYTLLL